MIIDMLTAQDIRDLVRNLNGDQVIRAMGKYGDALNEAAPQLQAMLKDRPSFMAGVAVGLALADAGMAKKVLAPPTLGMNIDVE